MEFNIFKSFWRHINGINKVILFIQKKNNYCIKNKSSLKNFVFILFFVFTGIQFFLVDINIIALAFFFLNYLLLMVIMYYHFFLEKVYSPFISAYLIFSLLFFVIAPLAQISKIDTVLPRYLNYLPYHWKQTIFYMKHAMYVQEGDDITGKITCNPNVNNERDLDIEISIDFEGTESENGNNNKVHRTMKYNLR